MDCIVVIVVDCGDCGGLYCGNCSGLWWIVVIVVDCGDCGNSSGL